MNKKPTYEELDQRVKELEKKVLKCNPAEEALIESEKLYRFIVENVTDIIWIVDMEMKFTYFSPSVTQMRGYSVEEAMAQSIEEAMTPASFESAMKIIAEELDLHNKRERDPARSRKMEAELTCKDGATVWTEIESNFIYNSEGQPIGIIGITRNITERKKSEKERKQTEEALRDSNEKLSALFQSSPMAIITLDPDGNVTFWNPSAEKMFGWKEKEVIGRFLPLVPEEKKSEHDALRKRVLSGEGFHNVEALRQKKDGSDIYISISTVPLKDSTGSISGIMSVSVDITKRKQTEEALKESERRLKLAQQSAGAGVWDWDMVSGRLDWSRELYVLFGLDPDKTEPTFDIWDQVLHPHDKEKAYTHIKKSIIQGTPFDSEYRIVYPDGEERWIKALGNSIFDQAKQPVRMTAICIDITDRKRAEESLQKSEKKYRNLIESLQEGIWVIDKDNVTTFVNIPMAEMLGYTVEEMLGRHLFYFMDERGVNIAKQLLERRRQGLKEQHEFEFLKKDGARVYVIVETTPFTDNDGNYNGSIAGLVDITERKKMEKEFLRSQKLETVGVLAGGIAHDFNNILTTILGNVSMARMMVSAEDELFELLSEAEAASVRAQTLTKQLLTFAKGGLPVKEITSIKAILKGSSSFVLHGSKSRCEVSIAEDLWPAEVDVGQISQVINNIVINANQAMPKGETIQIAAENLIIDNGQGFPLKPGRYIKISIKDQGVGIAEDHLANIFDPYFTTKHEGSGLGLATAYSIINKHNGHIIVESQLGVGTTFHIYLPASEKAVPEKEEDRLIKGQGRILVVDDEAPLRKMVGKMLKNLGYESEVAKDGAEAIRMFKDARASGQPYDAVILDLTIPGGMGGKIAIKKLLEIDPEVKAIVSSGYADDPVLAKFQEYGFKGMMPKPFESRSLGKVLHEVLTG